MTRNLFVSIDGLSGSGKTTMARHLARELDAHYYKTPAPLFQPIRNAVDSMASPFARYLYYYAGIAQAAVEIQALLNQRSVVCDKYIVTMLAYSRASGLVVEAPGRDLLLRPNITFILVVPASLRMHRMSLRGRIPSPHFLSLEEFLPASLPSVDRHSIMIDNTSSDILDTVKVMLLAVRAFSAAEP